MAERGPERAEARFLRISHLLDAIGYALSPECHMPPDDRLAVIHPLVDGLRDALGIPAPEVTNPGASPPGPV